MFLVWLSLGAILGFLTAAILSVAIDSGAYIKQVDYTKRSGCCDAPVVELIDFRCKKCGKFCTVKK